MLAISTMTAIFKSSVLSGKVLQAAVKDLPSDLASAIE
jgi:hypothetical protein